MRFFQRLFQDFLKNSFNDFSQPSFMDSFRCSFRDCFIESSRDSLIDYLGIFSGFLPAFLQVFLLRFISNFFGNLSWVLLGIPLEISPMIPILFFFYFSILCWLKSLNFAKLRNSPEIVSGNTSDIPSRISPKQFVQWVPGFQGGDYKAVQCVSWDSEGIQYSFSDV